MLLYFLKKLNNFLNTFFKCTKERLYQIFKMSLMNQSVECPICFEIIGDKNNINTECGHTFHASCIMSNITRNGFKCPCCRAVMAEEPEDNDSDSTYTSTLLDEDEEDEDEYEAQPFSDYALLGFRLFTNLVEGNENSQNDISEENLYTDQDIQEVTIYHSPPPTYQEVARELRSQGISYEQLVAFTLLEHDEYQSQFEDYERVSSDIWGKLRVFISNYTPEQAEEIVEEPEPLQVVFEEPEHLRELREKRERTEQELASALQLLNDQIEQLGQEQEQEQDDFDIDNEIRNMVLCDNFMTDEFQFLEGGGFIIEDITNTKDYCEFSKIIFV